MASAALPPWLEAARASVTESEAWKAYARAFFDEMEQGKGMGLLHFSGLSGEEKLTVVRSLEAQLRGKAEAQAVYRTLGSALEASVERHVSAAVAADVRRATAAASRLVSQGDTRASAAARRSGTHAKAWGRRALYESYRAAADAAAGGHADDADRALLAAPPAAANINPATFNPVSRESFVTKWSITTTHNTKVLINTVACDALVSEIPTVNSMI